MFIQKLRRDNNVAKLFQKSFIVASGQSGIQGGLRRGSVSMIQCYRRRGVVPSKCHIVSRLVPPAACLVDLEASVACFERDSEI